MPRRYFRCDYSGHQSEPCWGVCIPLTKGFHTIIDAEDYDKISKYSWGSIKSGSKMYAYADIMIGFKNKIKRTLPHLIVNVPADKKVDHKNGDSLDNRKCNLRLCTIQENTMNRVKVIKDNSSSQYKGVRKQRGTDRWCAEIGVDYKRINLGAFATEIEAAQAYDKAALKYHGEFAHLNFALAAPLLGGK